MGGLLKSSKSILSGSGSSHRGGGGGSPGVGVGGWGGGEGCAVSGGVSQDGLSKGASGSRRGQGLGSNNNNNNNNNNGHHSVHDGSLLSIDELVPLLEEGRDTGGEGQGKERDLDGGAASRRRHAWLASGYHDRGRRIGVRGRNRRGGRQGGSSDAG